MRLLYRALRRRSELYRLVAPKLERMGAEASLQDKLETSPIKSAALMFVRELEKRK